MPEMTSKSKDKSSEKQTLLKSNYSVLAKKEAFYTGGHVQFSKECDYIFCTCGDSVKIVNVDNGKVDISIKEDDDELTCFIVSPDDKYLFTAKRSLLLRMWNWRENTLIRKFKAIHTAPVVSMAFDKSATLLATGSGDKTIKVWDVVKQYCTHNFKGSPGVVSLLQFHPNPEKFQLFSTSTDCKIRLWDLETSKCLAILDGHFSTVTSLAFTHDHKSMISAGRDKVILIWDLSNRSLLRTLPTFENVEGLIIASQNTLLPGLSAEENRKDETYFVSVGERGNFKVWTFSDLKCIYQRASDSDQTQLSQADGVKEGSSVAIVTQFISCEAIGCVTCVTHDHSLILYDLKTLCKRKQFVGYFDEILEVRMLETEKQCIAVATNSSELKILELETSNCHVLAGHSDTILSLDVSYDESLIATCSKDNSLRIWQATVNDTETLFRWVAYGIGHTSAVGTVCWPKRSKKFLVSGSEDLTVKYWEVPKKFPDKEPVRLTVTWTEKAHDKDINSIDISPNDKLLATGSQDKTAKVWMVESGLAAGTLRGHRRGLWCVQFSPVDQCLATSSADGTIKIWAIADFTCVKTLEGHSNSVLKIQFVTRGMQIVSSGSDGLVKLWNVRTNECVKTFDEHEDKIWALAVSKQENLLVTGGADSFLISWKDITEEEIENDRAMQEDALLREQELSNLLQHKKFFKAISLAITLDKPFRVLGIFKDLHQEVGANSLLMESLGRLDDSQINTLLKFICDWNTNAKHAFVAQSVLSIIMKLKTPAILMEYPDIKKTIEALLPYSERHFQRVVKMIQQSTFVDYTWQAMKYSSGNTKTGNDEKAKVTDENEEAKETNITRQLLNGDLSHDSQISATVPDDAEMEVSQHSAERKRRKIAAS